MAAHMCVSKVSSQEQQTTTSNHYSTASNNYSKVSKIPLLFYIFYTKIFVHKIINKHPHGHHGDEVVKAIATASNQIKSRVYLPTATSVEETR